MEKLEEANTETIEYSALVERVKNQGTRMGKLEAFDARIDERVRNIELVNSSQQDIPDKIQHTEELIKEMGTSRESDTKERNDYSKEFMLILVSAVLSYILSKLSW